MDFIIRTIEKRIKRFEGTAETKVYYQVKVEYSFFLLLSYFWSKNFEEIGINDFILQGNVIGEIQKPSIGTIARLIQKLDIHEEISTSELTDYAELRNDLIGHGYSFEDNLEEYTSKFDDWYKNLLNLRIPILNRNTNIIVCQAFDGNTNNYTGTIYDYDGDIRSNWKCPKEVFDFELGNVYASYEPNVYIRLSPFIHIDTTDDGLYVFRNVQHPLLGKIRYNRIDKSDKSYTKCWEEFEFIANNGILKRQPNGSIINVFTPNYQRYIDVGSIKNKVYEFLIGKEKYSSVFITLWGHGGNGKTATAQKICEELSMNEKKPFEFIIFLSAKDRELNKYTGKIVSISNENRVTSFENLIEKLNVLIYSEQSADTSKIINEKSTMLLVIDDYETFEDVDKGRITSFIKQLNTNYHKVILTTRNSFLKIGDDIQTNELDATSTVKFLLEVLVNEHKYTSLQLKDVENEIKKGGVKEEIHKITLGKPIEIIRFVNCFVQKGKITDDFLHEMKRLNTRSERMEFLYGRNYQQLQSDSLAQDIFVVIGLLTPQDSLTSLISHIKLILNKKDDDEITFNLAIDKLVKLRLLEIDEDGTYKVDSKDILEIMKKEYDKRDNVFKRTTNGIYEKIKANIITDTDRALLNHVKSLRHQANPQTTIQQYKEIIRQGKGFSYEIKLEALLDLADFLFNHRGDKLAAVKLIDEYFDNFYEFVVLKRYASYAWSVNKEKAIRILEDFNSRHMSKNIILPRSQKAHLFGLIVMREGLYWNDKFEREYPKRQQIRDEFSRVYRAYGQPLYAHLKMADIEREFNSEELFDISLALENYVDMCYRLNNKQLAIEISNFAINKFPERYTHRFKKKLDRILGYRSNFRPSSPKDRVTVVGEKLKLALNNIDIINLEPKEDGYSGVVLKVYTEPTKHGYINIISDELKGRVYFREASIKALKFADIKEGDPVIFGFGKITPIKFGAINIRKE